jgi:hypothetical protein
MYAPRHQLRRSHLPPRGGCAIGSRSPASPKVPVSFYTAIQTAIPLRYPLSDCDVARIYKRRAAAVGLEATQIAGNSTRIGACAGSDGGRI